MGAGSRLHVPGCQRKRYVEGHHLQHWACGGDTSAGNMTLLCSLHHRLLHEGGFKMRRDLDGELHFQRADGRAIPRGGYRVEDMVDEPAVDYAAEEHPSMEGFAACGEHPSMEGHPPMEVRETRATYRIAAAVS